MIESFWEQFRSSVWNLVWASNLAALSPGRAGLFRSVRFGASSAHGRANMVRFNLFQEMGAFSRDAETGYYSVDMERMREAMTELSRLLLTLQGDGDYAGAGELLASHGLIGETLQADLERKRQLLALAENLVLRPDSVAIE